MSHIIALYKYSARTVNILNSSIMVLQISIKINYKRLLLEIIKFYFQNSVLKSAINLFFFTLTIFYITYCYTTNRKLYRKTKTERFLASSVPFSSSAAKKLIKRTKLNYCFNSVPPLRSMKWIYLKKLVQLYTFHKP